VNRRGRNAVRPVVDDERDKTSNFYKQERGLQSADDS
jgi:hypothetical protein